MEAQCYCLWLHLYQQRPTVTVQKSVSDEDIVAAGGRKVVCTGLADIMASWNST